MICNIKMSWIQARPIEHIMWIGRGCGFNLETDPEPAHSFVILNRELIRAWIQSCRLLEFRASRESAITDPNPLSKATIFRLLLAQLNWDREHHLSPWFLTLPTASLPRLLQRPAARRLQHRPPNKPPPGPKEYTHYGSRGPSRWHCLPGYFQPQLQ